MFSDKNDLENYFKSRGIDCRWVRHDKYGFSRHLQFVAKDTVCEIEWYYNYSTVIVDGVAHYWFDKINDENTYPHEGEWLEFIFGQEEHGLHIRVK